MEKDLQNNQKDEPNKLVTHLSQQLDQVEKKVRLFDEFYNNTFQDKENQLSSASQINNMMSKIHEELGAASMLKVELSQFANETLYGEGIESTKTKLDNLGQSFNESLSSINLQLSEVKRLVGELERYHVNLLSDEPNSGSTKQQIENMVTQINVHLKQYNEKYEEINSASNTLLIDQEGADCIKTQIEKIRNQFSQNLVDSSQKLSDLSLFYAQVFETSTNEKGEKTMGLKQTAEKLNSQLEGLIHNANEKLAALTDSSLHNSFATRANNHTTEYKTLQKNTSNSILGIVGVTVIFAILQLINLFSGRPFNYHLVIYELGITLPLIFLVWMYNRNQKIAKKLAEEYHHKAALSEAMTGYRHLYQLKHNDSEYLSLFNDIKLQLNINPSGKIDEFLNLKSPQETLLDKGLNIVSPESVSKLKEVLNPEIENFQN